MVDEVNDDPIARLEQAREQFIEAGSIADWTTIRLRHLVEVCINNIEYWSDERKEFERKIALGHDNEQLSELIKLLDVEYQRINANENESRAFASIAAYTAVMSGGPNWGVNTFSPNNGNTPQQVNYIEKRRRFLDKLRGKENGS